MGVSIFVSLREDPQAEELLRRLRQYATLPVQAIKRVKAYRLHKALSHFELTRILNSPFVDPILEEASLTPPTFEGFDWTIEVRFKPGVTDAEGSTARVALQDCLATPFAPQETCHSATLYFLRSCATHRQVAKAAQEFFANPLIEQIEIRRGQGGIDLARSDVELLALSAQRHLALNVEEMRAIRAMYVRPEVVAKRAQCKLPAWPTEVELEALAQTWSEHCKHKIFRAKITYCEEGECTQIDGLFATYIKGTTDVLARSDLLSVFHDNAGILRFSDQYNLAVKVETHNSPSALDPYGGALTGILGVNRDVMGAGRGARLLCNMDVLCFAPPEYAGPLPERLMHPRRIFEGVRRGIEHGGNASGVPTVNGAILFDERFLGKPLVYCGSVGVMPALVAQRPSHQKQIEPGDLIVVAGGRTGKDGIHGATFSSQELHAQSPASAVQIGDPFTQKKLHDFLLEARDADLFRAITDNGAGGFSSSIGELALFSGGCEIHLERAMLKSHEMQPWEIFLSESQERMTLATPPDRRSALQALADLHEVELSFLGTFTASGDLHVLYEGQTVGLLPLDFLHGGCPQMELEAQWQTPPYIPMQLPKSDLVADLHAVLARGNVCSKESIIRQYDHEVQASTLLKPLVGVQGEGPSDAALLCPIELLRSSQRIGVGIACGICPKYSDFDTFHMAACALDEAIRNLCAVGCDPQCIAILDNFCWPDPLFDPIKTPDGKHKLAQLVRACRALHEYAIAFRTPIISGKDSMKNDYKQDGVSICVPPTLLITAIGRIQDVRDAVSSDLKQPGELVFLVGLTKGELGGSEYAAHKGLVGGTAPQVDAHRARLCYLGVHRAMQQRYVTACHDLSDGGLAVCAVEMAIGGALGIALHLKAVQTDPALTETEILFAESASRLLVTVRTEHLSAFLHCMEGCLVAQVGVVLAEPLIVVYGRSGELLVQERIDACKRSWQRW